MALSADEILSQVLCMQGPKVSVLHSTKAKSYKMQGTVCAEKKIIQAAVFEPWGSASQLHCMVCKGVSFATDECVSEKRSGSA